MVVRLIFFSLLFSFFFPFFFFYFVKEKHDGKTGKREKRKSREGESNGEALTANPLTADCGTQSQY